MNIFQIPFYQYSIPNWNDIKSSILLQYEQVSLKKIENDTLSDQFLFTDYFNNDNMPSHIIKVLKILSSQINLFVSEIEEWENCKKDIRITSAWFEKLEKNMNHPIHNHGPIGFSSVCYVNFDKTMHLPTVFVSPHNNYLTGDVMTYFPEVNEGDIIFFPSFLMHYAPTNITEKERLIFSFNISK